MHVLHERDVICGTLENAFATFHVGVWFTVYVHLLRPGSTQQALNMCVCYVQLQPSLFYLFLCSPCSSARAPTRPTCSEVLAITGPCCWQRNTTMVHLMIQFRTLNRVANSVVEQRFCLVVGMIWRVPTVRPSLMKVSQSSAPYESSATNELHTIKRVRVQILVYIISQLHIQKHDHSRPPETTLLLHM